MTGQIPKYGENFRLERVNEYSATLSHSAYVLKRDPRWFIRSDKTSHKWNLYFGSGNWNLATYMVTRPTLTAAMENLLKGIELGFYVVANPRPARRSDAEHYYSANDRCICGAEVVYHEDTDPPGNGCAVQGVPWWSTVRHLDPQERRSSAEQQ